MKATDDELITALILIDYSRAFDLADGRLMLSVLHFMGFSDGAVNVMSEYLTDRRQYVQTPAGQSKISYVHRGVPRGSVLGPLLFSIYSSHLFKFIFLLNHTTHLQQINS